MERLISLFRSHFGEEPSEVTALPLSGSSRRYFRMAARGRSAVACKGSTRAENEAFFAISAAMCSQGLNAPRVLAVSPDRMDYLQEDLGDCQLFGALESELADGNFSPVKMGWIRSTVAALPAVQHLTGKALDWSICFPDREFNRRMVSFDLNYFKYDFLKLITVPFDEIRLQDDLDRLSEDALKPFGDTFMYRDFQARNIMIRNSEPWFIDFQGGRRGPAQYDLASFLWNAGTHFSRSLREELEGIYLDALDRFCKIDIRQWEQDYHTMILLRLLQEAGAYGYRGIVERKSLFLECIPSLLGFFSEVGDKACARYPYLGSLLEGTSAHWDGSTLIPEFSVKL
ncbi:MAG: phosphotransferase [Candidatus Cryptobacteroides sp.]|nr:phosphotransferase [Candidatus Cryptobacteroides sp.]